MQEYITKIVGSGNTTLMISNNKLEDIINIVKSLEDSGLILERFIETVQNEVKEQKGRFLSMLLGTLGLSLLGNLLTGEVKEQKGGFLSMLLGTLGSSLLGSILTGKRINRAGKGRGINRAGYGRPSSSALHNKIDF